MKKLIAASIILGLSSTAAFADLEDDRDMDQYYNQSDVTQAVVVTSQTSIGSTGSASPFSANASDEHSLLFPGSPSAD